MPRHVSIAAVCLLGLVLLILSTGGSEGPRPAGAGLSADFGLELFFIEHSSSRLRASQEYRLPGPLPSVEAGGGVLVRESGGGIAAQTGVSSAGY